MSYLDLAEALGSVMTAISVRASDNPRCQRLPVVLALLATAKAVLEGSDARSTRSGKLAFRLWDDLPNMEVDAVESPQRSEWEKVKNQDWG